MNNILVYDTSKGFSRFIKLKYSSQYEVVACTRAKAMENFDLKNYDIAFVIVNSYLDLANFLLIYSKVKNVFFGSILNDINEVVVKIDDITFLDLEMNKMDIIKTINFNLNYKKSVAKKKVT